MLASPNLRVVTWLLKTKELDKPWWCPNKILAFVMDIKWT
jgi:hypothetical protein